MTFKAAEEVRIVPGSRKATEGALRDPPGHHVVEDPCMPRIRGSGAPEPGTSWNPARNDTDTSKGGGRQQGHPEVWGGKDTMSGVRRRQFKKRGRGYSPTRGE